MSKSVLVIDTPENCRSCCLQDSHLIRNIVKSNRNELRIQALSLIGVH